MNSISSSSSSASSSSFSRSFYNSRRAKGGKITIRNAAAAFDGAKVLKSSSSSLYSTFNDDDDDDDDDEMNENTVEKKKTTTTKEKSEYRERSMRTTTATPLSTSQKRVTDYVSVNDCAVSTKNSSSITEELSRLTDAKQILELVEIKNEKFTANQTIQALHRIAISLTSRNGRLRRQEAKFVVADLRFQKLLEMCEMNANKLDKLGLERRKWSYAKLALPSEYRMRAALSVRLLDRAKDLQGDLMDAQDAGFILNRVEEQFDVFNKVNASTALHRLARIITQPNFANNSIDKRKPTTTMRARPRTVKSNILIETKADVVDNGTKTTNPNNNATAAATTEYRAVSTKKELLADPRFQALLEMCENKIPEMSPLGLSNVSWALARLFSDDSSRVKSLIQEISKRATLQIKYADAKCLSTILWALAALGFEPRSRLLASAQTRACEIEEEFRAPDVANALWAYAKWARLFANVNIASPVSSSMEESMDEDETNTNGGDRAVITALLRQSEAVLETFSAYQCANICWSSATLNAKLPETYLENLLERVAKESDSLDGVALTHAAWAVGVVGSPVHGESDAFQTLISACAERAAIAKTTENKDENRRRRVSKAGCAGALWACGRICYEPSSEDCEKLMVRLFDGESNNLDAQALAYAVWGISTIEDVELDERRRGKVMTRLKQLVQKKNIGLTHAAAFRAAADGAGLDASEIAETLKDLSSPR